MQQKISWQFAISGPTTIAFTLMCYQLIYGNTTFASSWRNSEKTLLRNFRAEWLGLGSNEAKLSRTKIPRRFRGLGTFPLENGSWKFVLKQ